MLQKRHKLLVIVSVIILAVALLYVSKDRILGMLLNIIFPTEEKVDVDGLVVYCNGQGDRAQIGQVFRNDGRGTMVPREFVTQGGELFVAIKNIPTTSPLDLGLHATVRVGQSDTDWEIRENTLIKIDATKGEYSSFTLDPGTYWLWVSAGSDIDIISCEPNNLSLVEYDE